MKSVMHGILARVAHGSLTERPRVGLLLAERLPEAPKDPLDTLLELADSHPTQGLSAEDLPELETLGLD